jgi:putative redox protein
MPKPPVLAELTWIDALRFDVTSARITTVLDGDANAGASPVQMLVIGLAGCMSADLHSSIVAQRAPDPPTRVVSAQLRFEIRGDVPPAAVERAIALSRDKYCSVWHSLRQDIQLTTSFDITV